MTLAASSYRRRAGSHAHLVDLKAGRRRPCMREDALKHLCVPRRLSGSYSSWNNLQTSSPLASSTLRTMAIARPCTRCTRT
eukprot:3512620-Heterocapsa_arctica.AAC.1